MLLFFSGFGVGCLLTLIVGYLFLTWLFAPMFDFLRDAAEVIEDRIK